MKSKKRMVIEISQLIKWPGMATGIPRTMQELSDRFVGDGAVFIDWSPTDKCFFEIDYKKVMRDRLQAESSEVATTRGYFGIRRAVRYIKSRSKIADRIIQKAKKIKGANRPSVVEFEFSSNDLLFVMWGETHDTEYTDALVRAHHAGAELAHIAHDMIPIATPQFGGHTTEAMQKYNRRIYPLCTYIYANSKHTKLDVSKWMESNGFKSDNISVITLGDDFSFAESKPVDDEKFHSSGLKGQDYILTVGTVEIRKNHYLYYYVYKLAKQRGISLPKLVVVGRLGYRMDDMYAVMTSDPDTKDDIIFLHNVDDSQLSWLYQNCLFSVYVSFYEGWGLPIAESIARGIPAISSNTSSMPEVACGLASYYISPYSPEECLSAIIDLNDTVKIKTEKQRISVYQPVKWDSTYQQIREVIDHE